MSFAIFLKSTFFFTEHLRWLILKKEIHDVKNNFLHSVTCLSSVHINSFFCTNMFVWQMLYLFTLGREGFSIFNQELKTQVLFGEKT